MKTATNANKGHIFLELKTNVSTYQLQDLKPKGKKNDAISNLFHCQFYWRL